MSNFWWIIAVAPFVMAFAVSAGRAEDSPLDLQQMRSRMGDDHSWMMWATMSALSPDDRAHLEPEMELLMTHYTHFPDRNHNNEGEMGGWSGYPGEGRMPNIRREWGVSQACGWSPVSRQGEPLGLHAPPGAYHAVEVLFPRMVKLLKENRHGDAMRTLGAMAHCIQDCATFPHMQALHRSARFDCSRIAIPGYPPASLGETPEAAAQALSRRVGEIVQLCEKVSLDIRDAMSSNDGARNTELRVRCCNEAAKAVADAIHTAILLAGPKPMRASNPFDQNLTLNGDVEKADFGEPWPEGWVAWWNDPTDRVGVAYWEGLVERNYNLWHSGRHSLKLMWAPKAGLEWRQTWPAAVWVAAGERYRATAWVKLQDATGESAIAMEFSTRAAKPVKMIEGAPMKGTQDWSQIAVEAEAPKGAERLRVLLRSRDNEGAAWFDDIEMRRVDPAARQTEQAASPKEAPQAEDRMLVLTFDGEKTHEISDHSPWRMLNGPNVGMSGGVPHDLHVPDGKFGAAIALDGVDDFAEFPASHIQDNLCPAEAMTFALWLWIAEARDAVIACKEQRPKNEPPRGYRISLCSDGADAGHPMIKLTVYTEHGDATASSAKPAPLKTWVHVAAVRRKDGAMTVYVNGESGPEVAMGGGFRPTDPKNGPALYLGADTGVRSFFKGRMDEVLLLSRAMTEKQVSKEAKK